VCAREDPDGRGHARWRAQPAGAGRRPGSEALAVRRLVHRRHCGQQDGGRRDPGGPHGQERHQRSDAQRGQRWRRRPRRWCCCGSRATEGQTHQPTVPALRRPRAGDPLLGGEGEAERSGLLLLLRGPALHRRHGGPHRPPADCKLHYPCCGRGPSAHSHYLFPGGHFPQSVPQEAGVLLHLDR
ncbi:hypothetical protein CRUP_025975, partial [Coryphaenoides rupestris]